MHTIKRLKNKSITLLLSILIAVSLLFGATFTAIRPAHADDVEDTKEFEPVSLSLSNTQFSSSSGSYPATPSSWTGENVDGGNYKPKSGVVDLTPSVYSTGGNKEYKLDQYPEYAKETDIPKSIFGEDTEFGGDQKTLMINTEEGASVAYAYKSEEVTLSANSFYRFSVWVKTGKFAAQTGATVKLTGLGQYFAFNNIDTVTGNFNDDGELKLDKTNNFGWVKYSLYVRTSASLSKSVRLSLGLGDGVTDGEEADVSLRPAHGYVFFDDVKAERISAFDFAAETLRFSKLAGKDNVYGNDNGNAIAIDLNETKSFTTTDGKEIGTFSQNEEQWSKNVPYDDNASFAGTAHKDVYNSEMIINDLNSAHNVYGFSQNPWAPYGKAEGKEFLTGDSPFFAGARNANIMVISTYDGDEFSKAAAGVASPFVKIDRFKYYRFSVWVKGDNVQDGNGISIRIKGKLITNNAPAEKATLLKEYTNLDGDSSDNAHYGWKEQVVYIHGSMLYDYDVSFELWLGAPDAQSSGIAMFDNVTLTELKYSDYTAMSEADSGNVYTIDDTENSTNIVNGNFANVGDMDEIKFPMPVADWNYLTTDAVNTNGFNTSAVDTDNAVHGIIPNDTDTFNAIVTSGAVPYAYRPKTDVDQNVLLLASTTKTAFCYQSPSITLSTDTANKLSVDMMVGSVNGYGASLVLKTTDGSVVSTIENITNTNQQFKTYTFYLAAPLSDQTVYLEVWLGLNDREDNKQKLSSGYVYVKQVALNEWTAEGDGTVADEFSAKLADYKQAVATHADLNYGIYSFASPSLDYYDVYSFAQNDGLGIPYQWDMKSANSSVEYGMFNTNDRKGLEIYPGFETDGLSGNMLYIYNTDKNYTRYTYDNSLSLVANKYYRIDVKVKVKVTDEVRKDKTSVGAGIALTGSSTAAFTNIKDTTTLVDVKNENSRNYETFKTYTFYISTGDNGGNIGLDITFGGAEKDSYIQGRLIVGGIEMTEIDNLDYETAQKSKDKNIVAVELSETNTETDNSNKEATSSEIQWWIIPTVIFSVLLVVAVILVFAVRIRDHFKKKRKVTYSTEYDRNDIYDDIERLREQAENKNKKKAKKVKSDELYEEVPAELPEEDGETETEDTIADKEEPDEQPAEQNEQAQKPDEDLDD